MKKAIIIYSIVATLLYVNFLVSLQTTNESQVDELSVQTANVETWGEDQMLYRNDEQYNLSNL